MTIIRQFPTKIAQSPNIIRFRTYATGSDVSNPTATIILPVPLALSNSYAVQFDDLESGVLNKLLNEAAKDDNFLKILGDAATNFGEEIVSRLEAVRRTGGTNINKNNQLTINRPSNRSFSFRFSLVPNNDKEAENIQDIIDIFKYAMHPPTEDTQGGFGVFYSPARFLIDFFYSPNNMTTGTPGKQNQKIFSSYFCFLTSLEVNQHDAGSPAYHKDGVPQNRAISLSFTELSPLSRSNIQKLEPNTNLDQVFKGANKFDGIENVDLNVTNIANGFPVDPKTIQQSVNPNE